MESEIFMKKLNLHHKTEDKQNDVNEKTNVDESGVSVIAKKIVQKPVLNPQILESIIPHLITCKTKNGSGENVIALVSKELPKLMSSGIQPYNAGIQYLSRLLFEKVTICADGLTCYAKDSKGYFTFPYDFPRLNGIVDVVARSYSTLEIRCYPETEAGKRAFARLFKNDINNIMIMDSQQFILPDGYINFLKNECNFEKAEYRSNIVVMPHLSGIFMLNAAKHDLAIKINVFTNFLAQLDDSVLFTAVTFLKLFGPIYSKEFYVTVQNIIKFVYQVTIHFPNVQKIKIYIDETTINDAWIDSYETLIGLHPGLFNFIPARITGEIKCLADNRMITDRQAKKYIGQSVGIVYRENGLDPPHFIKEFKIHNNLTFEYRIVNDYERFDDESDENPDEALEDEDSAEDEDNESEADANQNEASEVEESVEVEDNESDNENDLSF